MHSNIWRNFVEKILKLIHILIKITPVWFWHCPLVVGQNIWTYFVQLSLDQMILLLIGQYQDNRLFLSQQLLVSCIAVLEDLLHIIVHVCGKILKNVLPSYNYQILFLDLKEKYLWQGNYCWKILCFEN